ncbi:MAG TPA: MFS transporter [Steroidobacteraceae bacterium]|nr:MFS transporter [Steroidobacteraceae bacterium]
MHEPPAAHRPPPTRERTWIYGLLIGPSAVTANGVIQGGVLAYLLSVQNVGSGMQSHLIGLLSLPTSLYFLWSPMTDFFVRRRTWVLCGGLSAALLMAVSFHQPHLSSRTALALMFVSACCSQLVVSSCGGIMGTLRAENTRRMAASFYQAGSMGFGALAAWILIYLSSRTGQNVLGLVAAVLIGLPALAALAAPAQQQLAKDRFALVMRRIWDEFRTTFLRREALPYIACMTFPMASGAAAGLLPGVARQFGVGGDQVAWINGLLGGILMAAGAVLMSLIRTRMRVSVLYMTVSLVNCLCSAVLWLGPARPGTYYAGVLLYLFTLGSAYATFTAVALEFLGDSGKSGSGRYSIINSLGNIPVLYMLQVDGWGGDHWGGRGLAGAETVVGGLGALALLAYLLTRAPARRFGNGQSLAAD